MPLTNPCLGTVQRVVITVEAYVISLMIVLVLLGLFLTGCLSDNIEVFLNEFGLVLQVLNTGVLIVIVSIHISCVFNPSTLQVLSLLTIF